MLKVNYEADINNKEKVDQLFKAVQYESNDMMIAVNNDAIAICEKKIANKSGKLTDIQVEAEKSKKAELEKANANLAEENETLREEWQIVVSSISGASKEFEKDGERIIVTNDETATRNVLRLTACANNRKFFNYAILTSCEYFELFYESFYALHKISDGSFDVSGKRKYSESDGKLFVIIEKEIRSLIKRMFSVSIENEYTKKINVKFNSTDMGMLHECYTSGVSTMVSVSKKAGTISFDGYNCRFAITRKECKDGSVVYDGKKFMGLLATIAFQHICA